VRGSASSMTCSIHSRSVGKLSRHLMTGVSVRYLIGAE
jgi:hypothetical protein